MIETLFKTLGPWGLALGIMAYLLKVMVADKLTTIQRTLGELVEGQGDHESRIVRIETVMGVNGCMDREAGSYSGPRRRAADA